MIPNVYRRLWSTSSAEIGFIAIASWPSKGRRAQFFIMTVLARVVLPEQLVPATYTRERSGFCVVAIIRSDPVGPEFSVALQIGYHPVGP